MNPKTLGSNAKKVRDALIKLAWGILPTAEPFDVVLEDPVHSLITTAMESIALDMSFILRKDGDSYADRPYQVILQELCAEYRVTRLYTDEEGGYGQGYYYQFGDDPSSALLLAVHAFQSAY